MLFFQIKFCLIITPKNFVFVTVSNLVLETWRFVCLNERNISLVAICAIK